MVPRILYVETNAVSWLWIVPRGYRHLGHRCSTCLTQALQGLAKDIIPYVDVIQLHPGHLPQGSGKVRCKITTVFNRMLLNDAPWKNDAPQERHRIPHVIFLQNVRCSLSPFALISAVLMPLALSPSRCDGLILPMPPESLWIKAST